MALCIGVFHVISVTKNLSEGSDIIVLIVLTMMYVNIVRTRIPITGNFSKKK